MLTSFFKFWTTEGLNWGFNPQSAKIYRFGLGSSEAALLEAHGVADFADVL